jgi:hypothetical protein
MERNTPLQYWTVWYPKAASTGLLLARALLARTNTVLLHAAPEVITVEVSDADGNYLATGKDLEWTQNSPICRLTIEGSKVTRQDLWPAASDIESPVILPGGEAGILTSWWNSHDRKEWRWEVEFYNTVS